MNVQDCGYSVIIHGDVIDAPCKCTCKIVVIDHGEVIAMRPVRARLWLFTAKLLRCALYVQDCGYSRRSYCDAPCACKIVVIHGNVIDPP